MTEIFTLDELHAHYGAATGLASKKVLDRLDRHARDFIARSPFIVLSTADADGWPDASPKGDAPGFVAVADDKHLLIPDRIGNNRVDGFKNIMSNPKVGLIFFIPEVDHSFRVNGTARLLVDPQTCSRFAVNDKPAVAVLEVEVAQAFFHCGKALIRSRLWKPATWSSTSGLASLGAALADQIGGIDRAEAEQKVEESIRTRLY